MTNFKDGHTVMCDLYRCGEGGFIEGVICKFIHLPQLNGYALQPLEGKQLLIDAGILSEGDTRIPMVPEDRIYEWGYEND